MKNGYWMSKYYAPGGEAHGFFDSKMFDNKRPIKPKIDVEKSIFVCLGLKSPTSFIRVFHHGSKGVEVKLDIKTTVREGIKFVKSQFNVHYSCVIKNSNQNQFVMVFCCSAK